MKKRFPIKALFTGLTLLSGAAVVTGTVAWFNQYAIINKDDSPFGGSSSGAYFAYGNGTPTSAEYPNDRVYGITVPRHLYNLAWLQYLGYFNLEEENGKQYYFELADNIDMTGWALPPIGTEEHPFIGNFNGNGYVVHGLTVSNKFSDFTRHPGVVTSGNFEEPHILGFFGVIGNYDDIYGDSSDYSSAANEFINTGLTGITVKTYLKDSLMGVAAGYVSGNMKNVAVDASTINLDSSITGTTTSYGGFTDNISDFSLVGFTTKKQQVKKVDKSIYDVTVSDGYEFNASEQGDANGWGGSIDMMSVTQRLQRIRNTVSQSRFGWRKTRDVHDGVPSGDYTVNATQSGTNNYTRLVNNNDRIGHFNFVTGDTNVNNRYALLGGGHLRVDNNYEKIEHTGRYITDGTNYLTFDGSDLVNRTDSSEASVWTFQQYSSGVYYITTSYEGTTYYLYYYYGDLDITTGTGSTRRWRINDSGSNRDITYNGDTDYHLTYAGGWTLLDTSGDPYYVIHDGNGHYMGATSGRVPTSVSAANAMKFGFNDTTGNYHGYYNLDSTNYYLSFRNRNGYYLQVYPNNISATYRLYENASDTTCITNAYGVGYLRTTTSNSHAAYRTTRYVMYDNGWTTTTLAGSATRITIDYIDPSAFTAVLSKTTETTVKGPDEELVDTTSKMNYEEDDVTYFPLNTVDNTSNYEPADNNTAYVVGGSSLTPSITYNDNVTNVRFGYYPIADYIDNDYNVSTGKFTHIYTINNNMQKVEITNSTAYERLDDAKTNLGAVMKSDGTNVYGLHFMSAEISMEALTTAKYAKINKKEYTNYELPVNSIDFNLKEFGYVNFMAGSYFPGNSYQTRNDSFFALYQIERLDSAPNKINKIYEVLNVYQHSSKTKNYSYVYQLKDTVTGSIVYTKPYKTVDAVGTKEWLYDTEHEYTNNQYEPSLPANYNLVFNCASIKKNNLSQSDFLYHAWYFEIPMNDGEFCLGSDSSGVGSYLMYLDIGANASKVQRTIFTEHFTSVESISNFPDGVALVTLPETFSKEVAVLDISTDYDCSDSACVEIKAGYTSTFTIDRNNGDVTLTRTNQSNAPPVYAGDEITLLHDSGSSTNLDIQIVSDDEYEVKRMTYYDVNVNLDALTVTTITDTSVNSGSYTREITQNVYAGIDPTEDPTTSYSYNSTTDDRESMKVYNTSTGIRYTSDNLVNQSVLPMGDVSDSVILSVSILQNGGTGYEEVITLNAVINEDNLNGKYYMFSDYVIEITPSGEDVVIHVVSYSSGKTIYYGTTQVTGANQTITIAA